MANPTLLTSPIAENGDKNVIPASTGATTGLLDQEHGFQQINELPLQAGGLPPQRKDFNGAFNLLSKILFYAQKGYVFKFDENQDYYASCIVKDTDGGLYCAKADVPASSTHPKDDAINWVLINFGFNKKETFSTSGSFTAPITGTYRITLQGAGGGGGGSSSYGTGGGGGSGSKLTFYEKLIAGTSYSYTIGAGGSGGAINGNGTAGGASSITIGNNVYKCGGGIYGETSQANGAGNYGSGGAAYINDVEVSHGVAGQRGIRKTDNIYYTWTPGGLGCASVIELEGAGGLGGRISYNNGFSYAPGYAGGNGYITFEYCDI